MRFTQLVLITQVGTNCSAFAWFSDILRIVWALYLHRGLQHANTDSDRFSANVFAVTVRL